MMKLLVNMVLLLPLLAFLLLFVVIGSEYIVDQLHPVPSSNDGAAETPLLLLLFL